MTKQEDLAKGTAEAEESIRYLGQVLGRVLQEQEGDRAYDAVEAIRGLSVEYHVSGQSESLETLRDILSEQPEDLTLQVLRAFTYFLHLLNIAQDEDQLMRHRRAPVATLAQTLKDLRAKGVSEADFKGFFE
ncbi:MAG: phosphoenolpyruvate carboxylase, partial [Pseudomonadota bacterium]